VERFLWICLAGAAGTGARYLIGLWAGLRFGPSFPAGTLIVNLAGCFLMGLIAQLALGAPSMPPTLRIALTTGFLGGLTTYSSFNYETTRLLQSGSARVALLNLGVTLIGCFALGLFGSFVGRRFVGG
jgi:CrcB protein